MIFKVAWLHDQRIQGIRNCPTFLEDCLVKSSICAYVSGNVHLYKCNSLTLDQIVTLTGLNLGEHFQTKTSQVTLLRGALSGHKQVTLQ